MLTISGLESRYGGVLALKGVDLVVRPGELVAIIGPNGAGKTTLLKSILGLVDRSAGTLEYDGRDLRKASALDIVRRGVILVPEGRQVFGPLTVEENLILGAYVDRRRSDVVRERYERVVRLFPVLRERAGQPAQSLSGGEQQMLAIGRALMSGPRLLLVDEVSLGLAPVLVQHLYRALVELHEGGMTMVVVEQNARLALTVCDRAYVLSTGMVVKSGSPAELAGDAAVRKAYLGG